MVKVTRKAGWSGSLDDPWFWCFRPVRGFPGWEAAYSMIPGERGPVIAEVRILPAGAHKAVPSRGDHATCHWTPGVYEVPDTPKGGVNSDLVRAVPFPFDLTVEALKDMPPRPGRTVYLAEGFEDQVHEAMAASDRLFKALKHGLDKGTDARSRGRPSLESDGTLVETALAFDRLFPKEQGNVYDAMAKEAFLSPITMTRRATRARNAGLLSRPPKEGTGGGTATIAALVQGKERGLKLTPVQKKRLKGWEAREATDTGENQ